MGKDILYERAENMRYKPTRSEREFSDLLEIHNIKFKQQFVIGRYIVDFLIGKIVVEIDGESHNGREEYDRERDSFISSRGYRIIRIKNNEVKNFSITRLKQKNMKQESVTVEITSELLDKLSDSLKNGSHLKINRRQPTNDSNYKHNKVFNKLTR